MAFLWEGIERHRITFMFIQKVELIRNKKDENQMYAEEVSILNINGEEEII